MMGRRSQTVFLVLGACACMLLAGSPLGAPDCAEAHGDPVASLVLSLALILLAAKIAGHYAALIGQPPVLGELVTGVLIGNLGSWASEAWTRSGRMRRSKCSHDWASSCCCFRSDWSPPSGRCFLFGSLALGVYLSPRLFALASRLQSGGVLLATGLAFCFVLAWLTGSLAPLVGAFAAGLVLEDLHYPTLPALLGKPLCGLGVFGRGLDRLSVGIGMIPRGEVGLIFANMGLTLSVAGVRVVVPHVFSALVVMVIATTVLTPPALKWSFGRETRPRPARNETRPR